MLLFWAISRPRRAVSARSPRPLLTSDNFRLSEVRLGRPPVAWPGSRAIFRWALKPSWYLASSAARCSGPVPLGLSPPARRSAGPPSRPRGIGRRLGGLRNRGGRRSPSGRSAGPEQGMMRMVTAGFSATRSRWPSRSCITSPTRLRLAMTGQLPETVPASPPTGSHRTIRRARHKRGASRCLQRPAGRR